MINHLLPEHCVNPISLLFMLLVFLVIEITLFSLGLTSWTYH
jgi:hypothetical protein